MDHWNPFPEVDDTEAKKYPCYPHFSMIQSHTDVPTLSGYTYVPNRVPRYLESVVLLLALLLLPLPLE